VPEQRATEAALRMDRRTGRRVPRGVPAHLLMDRLEVELGPHPENYNMYIDVAVQLVNRGFAENPSGGSDYGTLRATDRGRRMVRGY
jgi:hypothetical protein